MSKNQEYAEKYAGYAMEQMRRYGIPASVTLAQGILESSNGQSQLAQNENNHFGIKATPSWIDKGGRYALYSDDRPNEKFCSYDSVGDSYEHHSRFLKENSRYAACFNLSPDDYKGWTEGIARAGYATGSGYAANLQKIIEQNGLDRYDRQVMQEMAAQGRHFGVEENPLGESESTAYSFPVERKDFLFVTTPFGVDGRMANGGEKVHKGMDIRCDGDAVLATENGGKVVSVKGSGSGQSVTVEYSRKDGSKVQCTYMHLGEVSVKAGDTVKSGQQLGKTGGEHLHFGVKNHLCGRHAAGHRPGGVPRRDRPERQHPAAGAAQRQRLARQIQEYGKHQGRKTAHHRRMDEKTALLGGQRRGPVRMQRSCRGDGHDRLHLPDAAGRAD